MNTRHLPCKGSALPAELSSHIQSIYEIRRGVGPLSPHHMSSVTASQAALPQSTCFTFVSLGETILSKPLALCRGDRYFCGLFCSRNPCTRTCAAPATGRHRHPSVFILAASCLFCDASLWLIITHLPLFVNREARNNRLSIPESGIGGPSRARTDE